jgi:SpoVK/Ycf46/Vps4 family AAA+-type ATPase
MKIKMPMFAPLRDVTIKMLSAFELERLQSVATDQMTKGRIHLDLEPVDLHTQDSSLPPWRRPDSTEKRSMTSQELDLEFRLSQLQLLESFPVQVGCFVSLESNDDARYIVQLVARADSTRQGDAKPMEGFVFSHDLSSLLLPHPPKPANTHSSSRGQNTMEVSHSPSVLQQVLPAESFFSSSLLQLVQEAGLCSDVVLHGERGCGKTFAALAIGAASRLCKGCSIVYQDCRKLRDSQQLRMNDVLAELSALFTDAVESSPCVVILDNLDDLIPSFDSDSSSDDIMQLHQVNPVEVDQAKLIRDVLLEKMRALPSKVKLVVTCRSCDSLSSTILSARNFDLRITLPDVDEPDRGPLFRCLLRQHCPGISTAGRQDAEFARRTVGFRPRDFEQLALRTLTKRGRRNDSRALKDCEIAIELDTFVPISRLGAVSDTSTSASMDDLGGLFRAKNELTSIVSQPIRYHRIYERARIRLPRGILLYGFPGTGKSMCGSALASQCGLPLIMCRGPELLDKYIGASEAKVRDLFARAAAAAPSILFLDEVDAMAPRRGSDHSGVTDRVVNQLLTFLDGVENTSGKGQVYVVATSSRPDKIDPALLRPGRLERHIYFGFAENDVEVSDLLSAVARRFNLDPAASAAITSGDFVGTARKESIDFGRFSPADVKAAFSTSQLSAAHEALSSGHTNEKVAISRDHLLQAFRSLRPSLLSSDFDRLGRVYATYRGDKSYEQSTANGEHAKPLMTALK